MESITELFEFSTDFSSIRRFNFFALEIDNPIISGLLTARLDQSIWDDTEKALTDKISIRNQPREI